MDRLHGRKRLLVAPPAASALLHPFPFLHPSHAQCQASPAALGPAALAAAGALEIELRPGELLYLPPLWFHEVEALSDAVSVNGWSDATEGDSLPQLLLTSRYLQPTCCLLLCY